MAAKKRDQRFAAECSGADFGDARLTARLASLATSLAAAPSASLPKALDSAELEAAYRFFRNDAVTPAAILAPHIVSTLERARIENDVLVVHDTTVISFTGEDDRERPCDDRQHDPSRDDRPPSLALVAQPQPEFRNR